MEVEGGKILGVVEPVDEEFVVHVRGRRQVQAGAAVMESCEAVPR